MSDPITAKALASEVANSNFKDKRHNARLRSLVTILARNPKASLPHALNPGDLEAAYRFFSNVNVTPERILEPHFEATRKRCEEAGDFLVVHDSTKFQYREDGEREGLGRVKRSSAGGKQAFFGHLSLALAADGTRRPLGVAGFKTWVRGPEASGVEYQRWEEQIRSSSARLNGLKHAIHVMDREADDYQMFDALIRDEHRFVARCQYDRRLETESGSEKLHGLFGGVLATVEREIWLEQRKPKKDPVAEKIHPARSKHITKLSIATATVALKRPTGKRTHDTDASPTVTLNVVHVWEADPPEGEEGVEWYLYTTEPISTTEQVLAIVDYYRARWVIEEYFKAIKTGCNFEKRQLKDYEGLVNLLATFAPIAYQMLLIRSEARRAPDAPAVDLISPDRMDVLRALGRTKLSANPTNRDVYLAIAALGGYIKRKQDPGWSTLSYGLEKLETLTEGWVAAKLQLRRDQR